MKIGILTVHRAINVGAVLQCYALQEALKSLGHDVWVINYVQEKVERVDRKIYGFKEWINMLFHGHIRGFLFYRRLQNNVAKVYKRYDDFLSTYLHLTEKCDENNIPKNFDGYVIGSDQLWNSNIFGYHDKVFWGNFTHSSESKLVAYAPSSSKKNLSESDQEFLRTSLSNFTHLSAREQEVSAFLHENFNVNIETVLDPTLLVNRSVWDNIKTGRYKNEKYVLVYGARPYPQNPNILNEMARQLADQMHCDVKGMQYETIPDYVDLVANASAVVTSSFHGVAFSLIFNRPLYAVKYGDEQDARYVNLLNSIGASNFLVDVNDEIKVSNIDYTTVEVNLDEMRQNSLNFIKHVGL